MTFSVSSENSEDVEDDSQEAIVTANYTVSTEDDANSSKDTRVFMFGKTELEWGRAHSGPSERLGPTRTRSIYFIHATTSLSHQYMSHLTHLQKWDGVWIDWYDMKNTM